MTYENPQCATAKVSIIQSKLSLHIQVLIKPQHSDGEFIHCEAIIHLYYVSDTVTGSGTM